MGNLLVNGVKTTIANALSSSGTTIIVPTITGPSGILTFSSDTPVPITFGAGAGADLNLGTAVTGSGPYTITISRGAENSTPTSWSIGSSVLLGDFTAQTFLDNTTFQAITDNSSITTNTIIIGGEINNGVMILSNGASIGIGSTNTGGNFGISEYCTVNYEHNWQNGTLTLGGPSTLLANTINDSGAGTITIASASVVLADPGVFSANYIDDAGSGSINFTSTGGISAANLATPEVDVDQIFSDQSGTITIGSTVSLGGNPLLSGQGTANIVSDGDSGWNITDGLGATLQWNSDGNGLQLNGQPFVMNNGSGSGGNVGEGFNLEGALMRAGSGGFLQDDGAGGWTFNSGIVDINNTGLTVSNGNIEITGEGAYQTDGDTVIDSNGNGTLVSLHLDSGSLSYDYSDSNFGTAVGSILIEGNSANFSALSIAGTVTIDNFQNATFTSVSSFGGSFSIDSSGNGTFANVIANSTLSFGASGISILPAIDSTTTAGAVEGQIGYDFTLHSAFYFNGTAWVAL